MARLDAFLEVLVKKGALRLQLEAGQAPALVFDRGLKPVSSSQPNATQILALLGEILPEGELDTLCSAGRLATRVDRNPDALARSFLEGTRTGATPNEKGFDEWFGTIGSNDMGKGRPSLEARRAGRWRSAAPRARR